MFQSRKLLRLIGLILENGICQFDWDYLQKTDFEQIRLKARNLGICRCGIHEETNWKPCPFKGYPHSHSARKDQKVPDLPLGSRKRWRQASYARVRDQHRGLRTHGPRRPHAHQEQHRLNTDIQKVLQRGNLWQLRHEHRQDHVFVLKWQLKVYLLTGTCGS